MLQQILTTTIILLAAPIHSTVANAMTATSNINTDNKAAAVVNARRLQATYTYSCQTGGSGTQIMKWEASVDPSHAHVTLTGLTSVDGFENTVYSHAHFSSNILHAYCKDIDTQTCTYLFRGKTVGTVDASGIHVSMMTGGSQLDESPRVLEDCVQTGPGLHTGKCPPTHAPRACSVSKTDVVPVN